MTLYVCEIENHILITHDGNVQLGIYKMSIEQFLTLSKVEYVQTYWIPDAFCKRYKRLNYQKHLKHQGQFLE